MVLSLKCLFLLFFKKINFWEFFFLINWKNNQCECGNYRSLSLVSVGSNLLSMMILSMMILRFCRSCSKRRTVWFLVGERTHSAGNFVFFFIYHIIMSCNW